MRTPGHVPSGPAYEHPQRDKIDFNNPINTIFTHADGYAYFGSKNGEATKIASTKNFTELKTNPADCKITKIIVDHSNCAIHGYRFFTEGDKCILETSSFRRIS